MATPPKSSRARNLLCRRCGWVGMGASTWQRLQMEKCIGSEQRPQIPWCSSIQRRRRRSRSTYGTSCRLGSGGDLYIAAGAPAVVYRVPTGAGKPEVAFKTADQHIRSLLMAPDGDALGRKRWLRRHIQVLYEAPGRQALRDLLRPEDGDHRLGDGYRGATCMPPEWARSRRPAR
jgi:hypothetical protein